MDVLLRELREGPDGIPEYNDTEISAAELTIGSGADQNIQLLGKQVAAEQAIIRKSGRRLELESRVGRVVVNNQKVGTAKLNNGDVILIGGHELSIAEPPGGFDVAIILRPDTSIGAGEFEGAFRADLKQTWLSKRKVAWLSAALILLLCLIVPLAAVKMHRADKPVPAMMPSDAFWTSGPLSAAHRQATGDRCDSCHKVLFQHVQDSSCLECHQTIHDHVSPERLKLTKLDPTQRCATCHREHNEPESYMVHSGDKQCTECHADSATLFPLLKVEPVRGFSKATHPAFTASLLKPRGVTGASNANDVAAVQATQPGVVPFVWTTEVTGLDDASEQSNLKFSHSQHLDPDRVRRINDSKALSCLDCHRPEQDGQHFEPIRMESRCASCHELTFDPGAPQRQLPHGKPRDVILTLQDYFTRKFSDPSAAEPVRARRRLPGHDDPEETCTGSPVECAKRSARNEIEAQFSRRGCIGCHVVLDTKSDTLLERFQVYPIRFQRDYFPAAQFDHRSHQIQGKLTGDDACLSCHAAKQSTESKDLLLPALPKCEECHGDKPAVQRVKVQCISCHAFHPKSTDGLTGRMAKREAVSIRSESKDKAQ